MQRKLLLVLICCVVQTSFATVAGDIGTVFDSLGFDGNVTGTSAYQGQEAGYYSGGSIYLRGGVKNVQLAHLDLPSYRAGCNGIDLFNGGFSFVSGEGLVDLGKKIMTASASYFVELAMNTVVPQLSNVRSKLQKMAQMANNANVNSCQIGQSIVGGLWPKLEATHKQICQTLGTEKNMFSDWAQARQKCGTGGEMKSTLDKASKEKSYQTKVLMNTNLIWDNLHRNAFFSQDDDEAELLMSLSGTIIFNDKGEPTFLKNLADNKTLVKMLLNGGDAELYHCDETKKCLSPTIRTFHLAPSNGLRTQVKTFIIDLITKLKNDEPLSATEKGFLNSTSIPVLKFMSVSLATNELSALNQLDTAADLISEDILKQYLLENLRIVKMSLKQSDYPESVGEQLTAQIQEAIDSVNGLDITQSQKLNNAMNIVQTAQNIEKRQASTVTNTFSSHANLEVAPS